MLEIESQRWKHWVGKPKSGPSDNHNIIKMKYTRNIISKAKFQKPMTTPSGRMSKEPKENRQIIPSLNTQSLTTNNFLLILQPGQ